MTHTVRHHSMRSRACTCPVLCALAAVLGCLFASVMKSSRLQILIVGSSWGDFVQAREG